MSARVPLAQEDRRALSRLMARTRGQTFKLAIIEVRSPLAREAVAAWLEGEAERLGLKTTAVDLRELPGENLWLELKARAGTGAQLLTLWGLEGERSESDSGEGLDPFRQLNLQRDSLIRDLPCLWALLVHPEVSKRLQLLAPDFADFAALWIKGTDEAPGEVEMRGGVLSPEDQPSHMAPIVDPSSLLAPVWEAISAKDLRLARDRLSSCRLTQAETLPHGDAVIAEAAILLFEGEPETAAGLLRRTLEQDDAAPLKGPLNLLLSQAELVLGELGEARTAAERALRMAQDMEDGVLEAAAHAQLSDISRTTGDLDGALGSQRKALRLLESSGDVTSLAHGYSDIARIYTELGDTSKAKESLLQLLQVQEKQGLGRGKVDTYGRLADLSAAEGDGLSRQEWVRCALRLLETCTAVWVPTAHIRLGKHLVALGETAQAEASFRLALGQFERWHDKGGEAEALFRLGLLSIGQHDNAVATQLMTRSLQLALELRLALTICDCHFYLGALRMMEQALVEAEHHLNEAALGALSLDRRGNAAAAHWLRARAFRARGEEDRAMEADVLALSLRLGLAGSVGDLAENDLPPLPTEGEIARFAQAWERHQKEPIPEDLLERLRQVQKERASAQEDDAPPPPAT